MNNTLSRIMEWWNAPLEKKSLKDLIFGKETLRFIIYVLIASFLLACVFLLTQMFTDGQDTEDTVAFIGVCTISLLGLWNALSNMRLLNEVWERVVYGIVAIVLGYMIFQLAMLLFFVFLIVLLVSLFGIINVDIPKLLFPGSSENQAQEPEDEAPNYGTVHNGYSGDYIQGPNGKSLRITDDLGNGDVRTEDGARYNVDANGHARKI